MRKRTTEDQDVEDAKAECIEALRKLKKEIKNWLLLADDIIRKLLMP